MGMLDDKIIIITGGASGIGEAAVRLCAAEGAKVVVADMSQKRGEAVCAEMVDSGATCTFLATDVSDEGQVERLVGTTVDMYGRLDGAFNNAGIPQSLKKLHELPVDDWHKVLNTNLTSIFLCMKYEIPELLKNGGGSIVNTSSSLGQVGITHASDYVASKHGVMGITRAAACDYARDGIRINALMPGLTRTNMGEGLVIPDTVAQGFEHYMHILPVGRYGEAIEVARGAAWLLSDAAGFVNGIGLPVDGGYLTV